MQQPSRQGAGSPPASAPVGGGSGSGPAGVPSQQQQQQQQQQRPAPPTQASGSTGQAAPSNTVTKAGAPAAPAPIGSTAATSTAARQQQPQGGSGGIASATTPASSNATAARGNAQTTVSTASTPASATAATPAAASRPQPTPATNAPGTVQPAPNTLRPLNVKDALAYLDQVKSRFKDDLNTYNDFLDIMKDFKTQVIDTPGVIDRVSSLFRDVPSLISNFNLFLPEGYRIECVPDPNNADVINSYRVITPAGVQHLTKGQASSLTEVALPGQIRKAGPGGAAASATTAAQRSSTAAASSATPPTRRPYENPLAAASRPKATAAAPAAASKDYRGGRTIQTHPPPPVKRESDLEMRNRAAAASSTNVNANANANVKPQQHQQQVPLPPQPQPPPPSAMTSNSASQQATAQAQRNAQIGQPVPTGPGGAGRSMATVGSAASPATAAGAGGNGPPSQTASAQPSRTATPGAASALSNSTDSRRPPIEFNHAISYVNKIKNRFIREPDVYKTFLDILQTYQKEQRPIQDVYAQVTKLFRAAPDLLEEFKQFLPDHSAQGQADAAAAAQARAAAAQAKSAPSGPPAPMATTAARTDVPPTAVPARQVPVEEPLSAAQQQQKRKRAAGGQEKPNNDFVPVPLAVPTAAVAGKTKQLPGKRVGKGAAAGVRDPVTVAQQSNLRYDGGVNAIPSYPQPILSYLPPGYTLPGIGGSGAISQGPAPNSHMTNEERLFFDRVADFIDDKFTYYEFLKLLNLFTQDIIDLPTLVSRAWLFIGSAPDLWLDFRHLVGWQDGASVNGRTIENGEWIVENIPAVEKKGPDLSKAESAGPSYRKLPPSEINMQCSGRDKLCWEVLNDEWVSVMSLGSEEVFLAHRKNPFEEALHRSEEERHEYDFHIEANLRTIALLEPIAAKIATMTPKERETFRLKPGLGGQSKSLYQRIIKKVYGKEIGREVIAALHENPCVSVPIVLARLKQKDEEWKRALREWNRVWREVDAKNFYRSLDHQGITFKAQDKRYINPKSLVTEIEVLRRTEMQKQIAAPLPYRPPAATYQLAYPIADETVLFDSLKLFLSYLDRAPGYHTLAERDRIEAFLRSLTSLVFAIPVSVLDAMLTPVQDDDRSGSISEDDMSDSAASSVDGHTPSHQMNGRRAGSVTGAGSSRKTGDLRKKALKNAGQGDLAAAGRRGLKNGLDGAETTPASSRDSTPIPPAATPLPQAESAAAAAPEDTVMAGTESDTTADINSTVEQQANGDSSFKTDVPTSAAGLEAVSGVEIVTTAVASPTHTIEQAQQPHGRPSVPLIDPNAPPETMQTAHDVVQNGPLVPALTPTEAAAAAATATAAGSADEPTAQQNGPVTPVLHNAARDGQHQIRRFNFFCNTPYYCAIRLLQLLYSRLYTMKTAAQDLSSTRSGDALKNTAYTKFGKANPRFSGQEAPTSEFLYESMLELCEKLFGSEIDQPTFEDGVRALFGNKAFHIFTIDKLLSSLVKTVWSLIDSNRETYAANGEIFKLLVDDRRYPTTAQAQQISYRINAELAAGSDEHLYRIEWLPRRHQLTFQLLGKDEVLPEDESDLSKAWERYIESFVGDTVTKGLPLTEKEIIRNVCLHRNLKTVKEDDAAKGKRVLAKSELETRICMRSYRMFWQGDTEDAMHRVWPSEPEKDTLDELENKRKERFGKWLEKRNAALEQQAAEKEKEKHNKEGASPAVASASAKPSGSVPPPSSSEATPKPEEKAENKEDREAKEKEKEESTDVTMQAATNAISSSA